MRLASVICIFTLPVWAQPAPDAATLLNQRSSALKNYYSYQYTEVMSGPMTQTTVTRAVNPDRYRLESENMTIVADGKAAWMYMPMFKRYSKIPSGDTTLFVPGAGAVEDPELLANAKVIRSEVLEVDGQPHDCWVVESRVAKLSVPFGSMIMQDVVRTYWIDKTLRLDLQMTGSSKMDGAETRTKTVKSGIKFNEHFPDSLFVFTPPPGAVESEEFVSSMKAMVARPKPEPKTPPNSNTAEAFVPNLNPIERIEPARDQNVHGMVEMILTIDPVGSVVKAEPLTGPQPLRQAAVDSVLQWKFRPVMRDGKPVYAYTEAMVDFLDSSKPLKPEDMNVNMAETMAYLQRTSELQSKYPRSPAQVLADLEQDRGSTEGVARSYALPELAKAALDAGDLEKAASYANELLQFPDNPNRGQAIHDGNMVLGLISLKQGDVEGAKAHLLKSGKSSGSATLDSFGPNMKLAKALLEKGEKDAVLQYFAECKAFWKMGAAKLDDWSAQVRNGAVPEFGANLVY